MYWLKSCARCGGDLYRGRDLYGEFVACLQCGHELSREEEADISGRGRPSRRPEGWQKRAERAA